MADIDIDDPAIAAEARHEVLGFTQIICKDRGGKPLAHGVVLADRFVNSR